MNRGPVLPGRAVCFVAALALVTAAIVGCESSDGTESPVQVTPETVTLPGGANATTVLQASGGLAPYAWSVSDATLGRVNASGEVAVYTRTAASGINMVTATDTNGYIGRSMIYQDTTP